MITNPKAYWQGVANREDWRSFILPRKNDADFDAEGLAEARRLFYFYDGNSTVVDYGCGVGRVLQYVAERAGHAVGLDICTAFLDRAREAIKRDNVAFFPSDEYQRENVADLVYSIMVLQHNDAPNRMKIMEHIHRILKVDGMAVVSFPRIESTYYQESDTLHKFTRGEVYDYGRLFFISRIIEGNLPHYEKEYTGNNEYFLIAVK